MENILIEQDYVSDGRGGIRQADGIEMLLCRALFRLSCRRGSFPFLPDLGSRLWLLKGKDADQIAALAAAYCAEALAPMSLTVRGVTLLECQGERIRLDVRLGVGKYTEHVEVTL